MWTFMMRGSVLAVCLALGMAMPALAQAVPQGPASVSALATQLSPAVVNIGTSRRVPAGMGMPFPDFPNGSPLGEMFDQLNPNEGQGEERMEQARSLGSGFIINADGHVVTNNHVIEGAEEIYVFLTDGRRLPATVVGKDDKTDLAVLKIEAAGPLPFVEFGDSDSAEVGDWVMAIGNPFGLGGSVTLGIVSARNRDISSGPYDNFIQTDASINQGNSGGPLFDMTGKVVGINTAIIARGGSSLGIGFAVPVNMAAPIVAQLAEFGETRRGWIGVGIQEVDEDIALSLGRQNTNGAMVVDVDPTGPSLGVLNEGDLILQFDGKDVTKMRDLPRLVAETEVGRQVAIQVLRNGEEEMLDITPGRLEVIAETAALETGKTDGAAEDTASGLLGLVGFAVGAIDEAARAEFGFEPDVEGPMVNQVVDGSDAYAKGLIPGLLVTEINQTPVSAPEDVETLVAAAHDAGREAVLLKVTDPAGSSRFIAVRLQ